MATSTQQEARTSFFLDLKPQSSQGTRERKKHLTLIEIGSPVDIRDTKKNSNAGHF